MKREPTLVPPTLAVKFLEGGGFIVCRSGPNVPCTDLLERYAKELICVLARGKLKSIARQKQAVLQVKLLEDARFDISRSGPRSWGMRILERATRSALRELTNEMGDRLHAEAHGVEYPLPANAEIVAFKKGWEAGLASIPPGGAQ